MAPTPVSLQNLCLIYIIRFLELFPVNYLALLPVTVRQRLLENLPPVDVCRLEQSKFSEGLDIDGVWKKLSNVSDILRLYTRHSNTSHAASDTYRHKSYKDDFFNQIYSYFATNKRDDFKSIGFQFETSLQEHRYRIVKCLCTPLRQQTHDKTSSYLPFLTSHDFPFILFPQRETLEKLPCWSLLDGEKDFPISTPNRYLPYYQPLPPSLSDKEAIKSMVFLAPTLCHYYPTELDININGFFNTTLGKLLNFTDDPIIYTRFFQQVEILTFTLCFTDSESSKFAIPYTKKQCQKCIQTILPPARRVLQQFAIRANSPEALGYMLECCIPILQDTPQTPQQSPSHNYTTLLPSLCHVTVALFFKHRRENFSPLSEQHGRLLQHFSTIFSGSQFSSFTVDGISFQDTPSSQPFGSILHSFLTSSTTHEQKLILRNVTATSIPSSVITPECGLHYKSLIIESSVTPNSVINWLLGKCKLHLKTLQLDFKEAKWCSTVSPQARFKVLRTERRLPHFPALIQALSPQTVGLTQPLVDLEFKNVHVKTLSFHTTRQVRPSHNRTVPCDFFEQILLKPTLKCLDLSHNGLGEDSILPHLTEALERRAQTVGALQELNLAHNHLGYVTHDNLHRLFNAIFSLPQLQELSLNICSNEFDLPHFTMLYTSWTMNSSGVKLQYLDYSKQDHDTLLFIEGTIEKIASECRSTNTVSFYT